MKKQILIAEDNAHMRFILQEFLKKEFEVITFDDGSKILDYMREGNIPDLVIADIQMPKLGGWELLCNMKASMFFRDVPVVILSANEKSQDRVKFLENGAEDYLTKPFSPPELNARISNIIKRRIYA